MDAYVIAIKRDQRTAAPPDWQQRLAGIDGLEILGGHSPYRVQVSASEEAICMARQRMGDLLHIEPVILHEPLSIR